MWKCSVGSWELMHRELQMIAHILVFKLGGGYMGGCLYYSPLFLCDKYFITHKKGNFHTSAILLIIGSVSQGNLCNFSFLVYALVFTFPSCLRRIVCCESQNSKYL